MKQSKNRGRIIKQKQWFCKTEQENNGGFSGVVFWVLGADFQANIGHICRKVHAYRRLVHCKNGYEHDIIGFVYICSVLPIRVVLRRGQAGEKKIVLENAV